MQCRESPNRCPKVSKSLANGRNKSRAGTNLGDLPFSSAAPLVSQTFKRNCTSLLVGRFKNIFYSLTILGRKQAPQRIQLWLKTVLAPGGDFTIGW